MTQLKDIVIDVELMNECIEITLAERKQKLLLLEKELQKLLSHRKLKHGAGKRIRWTNTRIPWHKQNRKWSESTCNYFHMERQELERQEIKLDLERIYGQEVSLGD